MHKVKVKMRQQNKKRVMNGTLNLTYLAPVDKMISVDMDNMEPVIKC